MKRTTTGRRRSSMVEAEERANGTIWMMDLRIEVNNIIVVSKK
jgi:hypothetical protein